MPDQQKPHLWIPSDRIRTEPIVPRGGGESYYREDLAEHSARLLSAFRNGITKFEGKLDADLANELIVEVTTAADRPVAKERQHLRALGLEILALSATAPNIAVARVAQDELPKLARKLERYAGTPKHVGKSNLAAVEDIRPVAIARKVDPALVAAAAVDELPCLISVYSGLPEALKFEVASRVEGNLRESGKREVQVHAYVNGAVAISARLNATDMQHVGEQFMLVRSIEYNGELVSESAVEADEIPRVLQIDLPRCREPVVVVDSGVNASTNLFRGLIQRTIPSLPPGSVGPHLTHGTFVASRVIYGDAITQVLARRATPWCPVIDLQVTGMGDVGERLKQSPAVLGEILQKYVPELAGEAKVFNLSLGVSPITDGAYSQLARLLDYLSREHKVLFVVSAGNIDDPVEAPPRHYLPANTRILSPGESLLALTVGSIAKYCEEACVAREGELSPFSRRGPGADKALKPELAAHGGNVFFDERGWTTSPRIAAYGVNRAGTHLAYAHGTSYAAPLVAQYAARLFDAYQRATPNLVKALLCHFSEPIIAPSPGEPLVASHFCGFGEPIIERALYAAPSRAGYLFQGSIRKNRYTILPFHVPSGLVNAPYAKLTVRGTVVFDPPVSRDDSVNYSLCRIAGLLRKRGANGLQDVPVGGGEDDARYPWNPLFHFERTFRRPYGSGAWELRLRLMTRGDLPDEFEQTFAVVLEVRDDRGGVDVRDAIVSEYPGLYLPVELRIAA